MALLGDFSPQETTDPQADPDTFTFCGEEFELPATAGAGAFLKFAWEMKTAQQQAERAESAEKRARTAEGKAAALAEKSASDIGAMSAVCNLLEAVLGESQLDRFLRAADRQGVPVEGLLSVVHRIEQAVTERPTRRSSVSSAGPSTSGPAFTGDGSGLTERPLTPREQQIQALNQHLVAPGDLALSNP